MLKHIFNILSLILPAVLLSGCLGTDLSDCPTPVEPEEPVEESEQYLSVSLCIGAADSSGRATESSRADGPDGGEDGDGREYGFDREYEINSAVFLLYKADNGINETATDPKIEKILYFNTLILEKKTEELTIYKAIKQVSPTWKEEHEGYNAIILTNISSGNHFLDMPLSQVRDYIVTEQWTGTTTDDCTEFVMSSESDCSFSHLEIGENVFDIRDGSYDKPWYTSANIERLAARIDIAPGTSATYLTAKNSDGTDYLYNGSACQGYLYTVYHDDGTTPSQHRFLLTGITITNLWNQGAYLIKRVCTTSDPATGIVTYLGDELKNTQDKATNFVLSSATATQHATVSNLPVKADLYDNSYFILSYAQENTCLEPEYCTGLLFHGIIIMDYDTTLDSDPAKCLAANIEAKKGNSAQLYEKTFMSPTDGGSDPKPYIIRHSDPTGQGFETDIMHYGIVRNNIYRIGITNVIAESESQDINLKLRILVLPWAKYTHDPIEM